MSTVKTFRALFLAASIVGLGSTGGSHSAKGGIDMPTPKYEDSAQPLPPSVTGAVVFTGGPGRVKEGLDLYAQGKINYLLISGVGEKTTLKKLISLSGVDIKRGLDGIAIDRAANTAENAASITQWQAQNNLRNIIVVTGVDHMDRALANTQRTLGKNVSLYQRSVGQSDGIKARMFETIKGAATAVGINSLGTIGIKQTPF